MISSRDVESYLDHIEAFERRMLRDFSGREWLAIIDYVTMARDNQGPEMTNLSMALVALFLLERYGHKLKPDQIFEVRRMVREMIAYAKEHEKKPADGELIAVDLVSTPSL